MGVSKESHILEAGMGRCVALIDFFLAGYENMWGIDNNGDLNVETKQMYRLCMEGNAFPSLEGFMPSVEHFNEHVESAAIDILSAE